ncbi:MAG: phosphoglycerate mutase (2,3-diphosphoglycerate-independent) [Candidatus Melainabacteria bacterium RIFCSPLOWO2_02_FULL_35_15]|nr:MAG: phosphoglycerate mutase (2,3-diphosphoglycerate-independent) [Candidatus Melainabacteria bacterium RIFCSPLOWO2_12_FULL_35_11]OGI14188.1 MAG: phosphoglycerate mutase (2,3-diphosphoglycerate-independent) [Candidatus Melainabacteria bacterium RIFCSPLOWO2_02_FULL_35_15]
MKHTPLTLVILDGWGTSDDKKGNAVAQASVPNFNSFLKNYPNTILYTCGRAVGLPDGVMGNSEVGHENIGGGRIVTQKLTLISQTIQNGSFFTNKTLLDAIDHVKQNNSKLHIMGLISEGDVHSHLGHLYALFELTKRNQVKKVLLHGITDGRDDPPKYGIDLIKKVEEKTKTCSVKIVTVCGRYYAMDRDNRWQRIKRYYDLVTQGIGLRSNSAYDAIKEAYNRGENKITQDEKECPLENSDEFIVPTLTGAKEDLISDNDAVIFFNFRPDRAREITTALTQNNFSEFKREIFPKNLYYVCLTEYDIKLHAKEFANPLVPAAFTNNDLPEVNRNNSLGEIISKLNLRQIRIAETEKYRHVTSFFNMGRQAEFKGEDRVLIPSPKVMTYDHMPEMSAFDVAKKTTEAIKSKHYALLIVNFANADMVGHTGIIPATVKALEAVDKALGEIYKAIIETSGTLLITADHGNAEQMFNEDGSIRTAHSLNPAPFIMINNDLKNKKLKQSGTLADIAPTILDIMEADKPEEMTGNSLIIKDN